MTVESGLLSRVIGQFCQFGKEVTVTVAGKESPIDADGLVVFAHDAIDDGHVALVVLVARMAAHGFLQQRHHLQGIVHLRVFTGAVSLCAILYLVEGTGEHLLGHRRNGVGGRACRHVCLDRFPVLVAQLFYFQPGNKVEH